MNMIWCKSLLHSENIIIRIIFQEYSIKQLSDLYMNNFRIKIIS
jgi:hypothetical protein